MIERNDINNMLFIDKLNDKTVFITGATGLIGSNIIIYLVEIAKQEHIKINIVAFVRDMEKAMDKFSVLDYSLLKFVVGDICENVIYDGNVDYIIHAASETSSKSFVDLPVETIKTSVLGTIQILDFAKTKNIDSFVYLSSMEVYGNPQEDKKIYEHQVSNLDILELRSSYPASKRMCENLCIAYFNEFSIPAKIIRLTQTFGKGVNYNDGRVFAEFARCIVENKNIILHTSGESKRSYLDITDAVRAILTVLVKGANGMAYNAANEETYCSIYQMASMVVNNFSNGSLLVKKEFGDISKYGYNSSMKMNLDTTKLKLLGWKPSKNLHDMYKCIIEEFRKAKKS